MLNICKINYNFVISQYGLNLCASIPFLDGTSISKAQQCRFDTTNQHSGSLNRHRILISICKNVGPRNSSERFNPWSNRYEYDLGKRNNHLQRYNQLNSIFIIKNIKGIVITLWLNICVYFFRRCLSVPQRGVRSRQSRIKRQRKLQWEQESPIYQFSKCE